MGSDCTQTARLLRIEQRAIEDRQQLQTHGALIKEIRDALLPTEFHPENGLINQVKNMSEETRKRFDESEKKMESVEREFVRMKTYITAVVTVLVVLFTIAQFVINLIF